MKLIPWDSQEFLVEAHVRFTAVLDRALYVELLKAALIEADREGSSQGFKLKEALPAGRERSQKDSLRPTEVRVFVIGPSGRLGAGQLKGYYEYVGTLVEKISANPPQDVESVGFSLSIVSESHYVTEA